MAKSSLSYKNTTFELSYEMLNLDKEQVLLILHGWGANKELMKQAFKDKFQNYKHLYIDLCGFGGSNAPLVLTSSDYAEILRLFLEQKKLVPSILMGHSFGGKICTLLSFFYKENLKGLILLSSAGIIWKKRLLLRLKIKFFKLLKTFKLARFYKFFVSKDALNLDFIMYETFKKVVDENFSEIFKQVEVKSFIFWGIEDEATPLKSGELMHSLIKNSKFYALAGNHFFFLEQSSFIESKIKEIL